MLSRLRQFIGIFIAGRKISRPEITHIRRNVLAGSHRKKALLSYIAEVFGEKGYQGDFRHTNRYTSYLIAETLNELGFNVDVVSWNEEIQQDFSEYSLVIGLGKTLDHVIANRNGKAQPRVIWFGTGCNPLYSNIVTLGRVTDFYQRTNKLLMESSRYIKEDWPLQHEFADHILLHGDRFARNTYSHGSVDCMNAPVFISVEKLPEKNWNNAKRSFLWFGTGGMLHKGLDLVLEVFAKRGDCELHVCGDVRSEKVFFEHYRPLLETRANIHSHGFVDVRSEDFIKVLQNCCFVIFPSASEGNSPSVITCMANGGLIPVVSDGADIDTQQWGIRIDELSVASVERSVDRALGMSEQDLRHLADRIFRHTNVHNSFQYFKSDLKQKLERALEKFSK